jgi:hypothetical protein
MLHADAHTRGSVYKAKKCFHEALLAFHLEVQNEKVGEKALVEELMQGCTVLRANHQAYMKWTVLTMVQRPWRQVVEALVTRGCGGGARHACRGQDGAHPCQLPMGPRPA